MRVALAVAVALSLVSVSIADQAAASIRKPTAIPAQELGAALKTFAADRGLAMVYRAEVVSKMSTSGASGELTLDEALRALLSGTDLTYKFLDDKTVTIVPLSTAPPAAPAPASKEEVKKEARKEAGFWDRFRISRADTAPPDTKETAEASSQLEEIVVTAQKRRERLIDVPMSVGAVSGERLQEQGVQNIHDLSYTMPSLSVRDTGPGQQLITIRGIGNSRGSGPLVGIYLDEAPLSSISFSQVDLRVNDLERVEVLRGPQGTLYGEGSVGGTLRFITRKPQLDRLTGSVGFSLSNTQSSDKLSNEMRGVLNLPLAEDKFGVRIAALYDDASGWIDQPDDDRKDINDHELREVRVSALWRPFEGLELLGSSTLHRVDGGGQSIITGDPDDSEFRNPLQPQRRPFLTDDYDVHNLTVTYDTGFAQLVSSTTYMDKEATNFNFNLWQPAPADSAQIGLTSAVDYKARSFAQELRLTSKEGSALGWTAGAFYRDLHTETGAIFDFGFVGVVFFPEAFSGTTFTDSRSWSVFGDVHYDVTDRVQIGAGARYFKDDVSKSGVNSGVPESDRDASFHSFDPRLYATFAINENMKLYANAAKGFRSGGFNGDLSIANGAPATFEPEELLSYEAGLKSVLLEGRLSANISAFFSDYKDMQVLGVRPGFGVVSFTSNGGDAEVKGVELELGWRPVENWIVGFNGSLIDTKITKILTSPESSERLPGDRMDLVPKYTYAASVTRLFPLPGENHNLAVSVDYAVHDGSTETSRSLGLLNPVAKSDTLTFLDANVRLQRNAWSFDLFGQNLLDDRDAVMPSLYGYLSQARPRTFGLRVNYQP